MMSFRFFARCKFLIITSASGGSLTTDMYKLVKASLLLFSIRLYSATALNTRPIIGVVSEREHNRNGPTNESYIAASYVKFIESAGARVAPILSTSSEDQISNIFNSVNGILFPGGAVYLNDSDYGQVGRIVFKLAKEANDKGDYFPVWGTCLGFELLSYLQAGIGNEVLTSVDGSNLSLPLVFTPAAANSRLFSLFTPNLMSTVSTEKLTFNSHTWAVTTKTFNSNPKLSDFYTVLSTNRDRNGIEFVSSMEAKKYPFYGVQWHPEKNGFEWTPKESINHSEHAVAVMQSAANFLAQEARKSNHSFPNKLAEEAALIYQHTPTYTGSHSSFTQIYTFTDKQYQRH